MNDTLKTIASRYSCRSFKPDPVPTEMIDAIANAAVQAPSGMNRQAWRAVVVTDKQLIEELDAEAMSYFAGQDDKSFYERMMSRGGKVFYNAPCMIIIPVDSDQVSDTMIDCGIITENIVLAATSLGLGNVICGLARFSFCSDKAADFKKRLKFPDGYDFGMSVLIGYSANETAPHVPDTDKIIYIR